MDEEDTEKQDDTDGYVDADTDLIPGTYEGGLKTWEGGLDLVEVLAESSKTAGDVAERIRGKRILEVRLTSPGCMHTADYSSVRCR